MLSEAKAVTNPGTKEEGWTKESHEKALCTARTAMYRSLVARLGHLAAERPDIAFSVKELARTMSASTEGLWGQLERLGRYRVAKPRLVTTYGWQVGAE